MAWQQKEPGIRLQGTNLVVTEYFGFINTTENIIGKIEYIQCYFN